MRTRECGVGSGIVKEEEEGVKGRPLPKLSFSHRKFLLLRVMNKKCFQEKGEYCAIHFHAPDMLSRRIFKDQPGSISLGKHGKIFFVSGKVILSLPFLTSKHCPRGKKIPFGSEKKRGRGMGHERKGIRRCGISRGRLRAILWKRDDEAS